MSDIIVTFYTFFFIKEQEQFTKMKLQLNFLFQEKGEIINTAN